MVAYGAPELLTAALAPLVDRYAITVVDNSSDPRIAAIVREVGGAYWDPGANLGFGSGVNHGLRRRQTPGTDVLLLNPDAEVDPNTVARLQEALHAGPRIAAVGPRQVDENGTPAQVAWPYPRPAHFLADAVKLGRLVPAGPLYVIGSVLMLRADALDDVGYFDEEFFLYAEEADWEVRALERGWSNLVVEDALATHVGAGTSSDSYARDVFLHAGLERYLRKHHGWWGWQISRWAIVIGGLPRIALFRGDRRRAARARVALFAHGPVALERRLRSQHADPSPPGAQ